MVLGDTDKRTAQEHGTVSAVLATMGDLLREDRRATFTGPLRC